MKVVFDDPQFSFQFLRMLGGTAFGTADIGECLATASNIQEGDYESWHKAWLSTAERVHALAEACEAGGHVVSAREAYLRAGNYFRAAEFYLHGDPHDPRILELSGLSLCCFGRAARMSRPPILEVEIPYEGTSLPGHFYRVDETGVARPTLIAQTGFDGTIEELIGSALAATARGWNCLAFEGPGQGRVIREQGLPFRPDWEKPVGAVIDYACSRPEVDTSRLALLGISFGGYLAPRAAAFDHRVKACVANGGVFDFFENRIPPGMSREDMLEWINADPEGANREIQASMAADSGIRWAVENGMYTFGASTPADWFLMISVYHLRNVAEKITCPTLVIDSEHDQFFPGQARKLYDALVCPKDFLVFTAEEGAGEHCQIGAAYLSSERIMDWLEERLGGAGERIRG